MGPVNNWLYSLFSQVDARDPFVQHVRISCLHCAYTTLWYKDTADRMEAVDGAAANQGFLAQRRHISQSRRRNDGTTPRGLVPARSFPDQRRRCQDTTGAQQGRVRAHGRWCKPQLQNPIRRRHLVQEESRLSPAVQMAHIKALEKSTIKYPMHSVDCKVYSIPRGARSHTHENLFLGTLPK